MRSGATREWRRIARGPDVLYYIAGWPDKKGTWTEEEFYAVGRSDWHDFKHHWTHYEPSLQGTCVEIGCGAGRLTSALALDFDRVVGLDVSSDMLERAARVVPANVELEQVDGSRIPLGDNEADAVFSVHVLQHLETWHDVVAYLGEANRVLRTGGTMMVHIWLGSAPLPAIRRLREEVRLWLGRWRLWRGGEPSTVRMRTYTSEAVGPLLLRLGFADIELRMFPTASNGFHHHFWLARVSPAPA